MNVVACYKVVPDGQDITARADGSLDTSKAQPILGEYDLLAIEEAVRIAEATGGKATLISAGGAGLNNTKLNKAALSRGPEELLLIEDETLAGADPFQTATVLAAALKRTGFDLVICGEGSADLYAQQTGTLLGEILGVPTLNAVSKVEAQDGKLKVERSLESEVEVLEVALPAVISVTSDINLPRIPQMKEILAAGKKPVEVLSAADLGDLAAAGLESISTLAPESIERRLVVLEGDTDENIESLVKAIRLEG
jgi:electron transfer flavoprotein beta subunit